MLGHAAANDDLHPFLAEEFGDLFRVVFAYLQSPPTKLSLVAHFHNQDPLTETVSWGNPLTVEHNCQLHDHPGERVAAVNSHSPSSSSAIPVPHIHYYFKLLILQDNFDRTVNCLAGKKR